MQKILRSDDLIVGGYYVYKFTYYKKNRGKGFPGNAIIKFEYDEHGHIPWLPLHEYGKFFMNKPSMYGVDFIPATYDQIRWLDACIAENKFIPKHIALDPDNYDIFTCN